MSNVCPPTLRPTPRSACKSLDPRGGNTKLTINRLVEAWERGIATPLVTNDGVATFYCWIYIHGASVSHELSEKKYEWLINTVVFIEWHVTFIIRYSIEWTIIPKELNPFPWQQFVNYRQNGCSYVVYKNPTVMSTTALLKFAKQTLFPSPGGPIFDK